MKPKEKDGDRTQTATAGDSAEKLKVVLEGGKRFGRGGNSLVDVLDLLVTMGQEQEGKGWIDNQTEA